MRKWLLLLLAVCWPSVASADLTVNDFAYGIRIDVPGVTAVAAMSLPEQVYGSAFRTDLGDVRVFNASGEPVPHLIRFAQTLKTDPPWQSLAFFPLPETATPEAGGYRVFVRTGPDGAVVRVDPRSEIIASQPARTFLIDLSRVGRSLSQLRLQWQPGNDDFMATLAVDASDDLASWTPLVQRSVLSDIRYGGHRLRNDTISLKPSAKRYLRLRQLDSGAAVSLVGIESRDDFQANWTRRFKGLFYRMDVDNPPLTSNPQAVPVSMDRLWRLSVNASDSTIGSAVPRLEIGYRPHDLFFIARGRGPFTLAFGSAAVEPLKVDVAALFDGIGRHRENGIQQWVMPQKNQIVLGGPQRLSPLPKPLPMRRVVLWSILLAGVLVVAVMAWRLARRMKG